MAGHELLEDLAEHLGIYRNLHVERGALRGGEVEADEEAIDNLVEAIVRYDYTPVLIIGGLLEESAVQIQHLPYLQV